ncbi:NACHT domain-containing protein [Streptomyces sp. NPDC093591]|uniref:NACHT domain-containing protein n=1 Tax=Streptomyces sp. NPDC093591 TaxID=3366044 RepID=UPI0038041B18
MYLLLAVGGAAGALWLTHSFHLSTAETAVTLSPTAAGLYLSWVALRSSRSAPPAEPSLEAIADQLAVAVRRQWEAEAGVRGVHDPRPLTVAWREAPECLVEQWGLLRRLAEEQRAVSGPTASGWAIEPAELAGSGRQIMRVFRERVPTQRLVVLGGPGSGKTMLLVRLLLDLMEGRSPGTPVPVLFTLSSWDPAGQDLQSWLVDRLLQDFEELAARSPDAFGGVSRAEALLAHRLVLPLLDGFDELPAASRSTALDQINSALPAGQPVVLSSRVTEYGEAAAATAGLPRKLTGAAGIELLPLDPAEIAAYLRRDAGGAGTPAAARWDRVVHSLGSDGPVSQALSTPLMIFLARSIYNPRTGESPDEIPAPDELLDDPALSNRAAVEAHLLAAFVPAAYRAHPRIRSPWSAEQAERALRWLARHMERVQVGSADLAWWHLHRAVPSWLPLVILGVLAGAMECTVTWVIEQASAHLPLWVDDRYAPGMGWVQASSGGLIAGLAGGLAGRIPGGLIGASIGATSTVLGYGDDAFASYQYSFTCEVLTTGLIYGFVGGLMGELASGLAARRAGAEHTSGLRWSWGAALLGIVLGAGYMYVQTLDYARPWDLLPLGLGLAGFFGLAGGLAAGQARRRNEAPPAANARWSWDWGGLLTGLGGGLAVIAPAWSVLFFQLGLTKGLAADLTRMSGLPSFGSTFAAGALAAYCLVGGITQGIKGAAADLTRAPSPAALLTRDHRTFRRLGRVTAAAVAVVLGLVVWCASSPELAPTAPDGYGWESVDWVMTVPKLLRALVIGSLVGILVGLAVAWNQTAGGSFFIARGYLAVRHRLPWRLMDFLADAHEHRGVLRQSGAVYQFRHVELQRHHAAGTRRR